MEDITMPYSSSLHAIANWMRGRACNWCRAGFPGRCRNTPACHRALANASVLDDLADQGQAS
jgi:hypothetical protein